MIVNADDFGFSAGVTEGILLAHREGIVTSTTLAVNMPAAAEATRMLADAPRLGVGVHLNVTQGPTLSRGGRALAGADGLMNRTPGQLLRAVVLRPGLLGAIEAECDAQIRRALEWGIRPTHLDSHQHVHGLWPVFVRVACLARRHHVPFVRWYREELVGPGWPDAPRTQRRTSRFLNVFGAGFSRLAPGLRGTCGTWGVAHTGRITVAWFRRVARAIGPGAWEIMTHPGCAEDLDRSRLRESRRAELSVLCDGEVRCAFQREGIQRIHYGQL